MKRAVHAVFFRIKCLCEYVCAHLQFYYRGTFEKERFQKLEQLKDKYRGQRCFLVGSGPSLTDADVLKLQNENTFMVNSFALAMEELDFYPTFYGFIDAVCMDLYGDKILANEKSIIFYPRRPNLTSANYNKLREKKNAYEFRMLDPGEWIYFSKKMPMEFSTDAAKSVGWGYTVIYSAMQLLVYMGFGEIYLLGMDCSYPKGIKCYKDCRSDSDIAAGLKNGQVMDEYIISYRSVKQYCDKVGIRVYNATRGGHLEVFPRVDLDEVVK